MSAPIVEIEDGKLKGQESRSYNDFQYFTFKGVPYAKPPVGDLRFSIPQPPEAWEGIRDATKTCNACAQFNKEAAAVVGNEDCLYLNVYTPKLTTTGSELLPVMVFFHGGGFLFGSGTDDALHGPDYLINKDVVIVSINYRLGILGFLSLDRKEAPGNMGLMDQVQSLKWVQKNISKFGGNPKNVTIFGVSAGGASVVYLLLSPMAKDLFHKAISQSGSPLQHWAHNIDVKKLASRIPSIHGKTVTDDDDLLKYLKQLKINELITASMKALAADEFRGGIHFGYVPTVEKPCGWEPFLSKSPYLSLARGEFNKVPYITGFCTREALVLLLQAPSTLANFVKTNVFSDYLPFDLSNEEKTNIETKLKTTYLESEPLFKDKDAYAIEFFTDVDFLGALYVTAKLIANHSCPVYFYEFSYDGNLNYMKISNNIQREGPCHADESGYLIRSNKLTKEITDDDRLVRDKMTTMWTNFAKYGNPTPVSDNLITTEWKPMPNCGVACLVINKTTEMKCEVYPQRLTIFEELYERKCDK